MVVEEVVVTDKAEVVVVVLPVEGVAGEDAVVVAVDLVVGVPTSAFFEIIFSAEDFAVPGVKGFSFVDGIGLLA